MKSKSFMLSIVSCDRIAGLASKESPSMASLMPLKSALAKVMQSWRAKYENDSADFHRTTRAMASLIARAPTPRRSTCSRYHRFFSRKPLAASAWTGTRAGSTSAAAPWSSRKPTSSATCVLSTPYRTRLDGSPTTSWR
eukprot:CAMPEP_0179244082 /NCGR_PEP_ID=MMETSP0797-20121207/17874_1 /TAXON_ID=47934 /ORGANISM="Dinophysis acuminata, Strain DAEP01" /LENGTH=138 /DNA_ID=CAMNT_0020951587 /DNA_START=219 /DNA_END=631 /DNA_ORIENTATION=+